MNIRQEYGRMVTSTETNARALEFAKLAHYILRNDGKFSKAAISAGRSSRDVGGLKLADIVKSGAAGIGREILKAAQSANVLSGSAFADYSQIANGFIASLVNASAFDGMLSSMVPTIVGTGTVGSVNVAAQAFSIIEGSAKAMSKLSLSGMQQNPQKAHCLITFSSELARIPQATPLIQRELRNSVALATDQQFIATLIAGLTVFTSSGSTAESVRFDLANLLRQISTGATSKLFILTTSLVCKSWSMLTSGAHGDSAFPDLGPQGGMINKIPVLVSDGVPAGDVIVVDASGIAAGSGDLVLEEFREASLQFESVPDSPPLASSAFLSLWQLNLVGLMIERWFVTSRLRSDAVSVCSNPSSYSSGNSPP